MMKRILLLMTSAALAVAGRAQWNSDPTIGTAVESAVSTKNPVVTATDGAGGAFVAWIENSTTIKVQRILASGTLKFGSAVTVSNATGSVSSNKTNLVITSDGAGGAICVWQDERTRLSAGTARDEIYGQRIDANGTALWTASTPPDGVRLTVATSSSDGFSRIVPLIRMVNATEAVVVFGDNRQSTTDLFAQKILISTGATQWVSDVSLHGNLLNIQTPANADILPDGSGGLFVAWQDPRVSTTDNNIYAQLVNNAGTLQWGPNGAPVATISGSNQNAPRIAADGSGGIVCTWLDLRVSASNVDVYAQRLDATGTAQWTTDGVVVCNATGNQNNPLIVNSGSNFIISWADNRVSVSDRNIYAQSITLAGAVNWAANGVAITQATGNQPVTLTGSNTTQFMVPDGSNGAVIFWDDSRNGSSNTDIYAQRVNSSGVVQWTTDGVPVSTATNNQSAPVAVPGLTTGSFVVAWRDGRSGTTNGQIYAARIQPTGSLPVRGLTLNAAANGSAVDVKWNTLDESNTFNFVVEKSTDGVSFASIGSAKAKGFGNGSYALADAHPVKGANFYRIKSVDTDKGFAYSAVVKVDFNGGVKTSLQVYPNPVQSVATLQLNNFAKGVYTLSVRDLTGRLLSQKAITVLADYQQSSVPLQGLPSGSYLLQIANADSTVLSTMIQKD